jgi:protein-disulfide isomerase
MKTEDSRHALNVPVSTRDHVAGSLDAPFQLLEYGDYECPYCGAAQPVVEEVRRHLGSRLCFAFRHFPIVGAHPHALHAAEAAEAAGAQDRFWDMHARLFAHQDALDDDMLLVHATQLGLDRERFLADMVGHAHLDRIREDLSSGARSGVNGTPTFFVNGLRYEGVPEVAALSLALERTAHART